MMLLSPPSFWMVLFFPPPLGGGAVSFLFFECQEMILDRCIILNKVRYGEER